MITFLNAFLAASGATLGITLSLTLLYLIYFITLLWVHSDPSHNNEQ